MKFTEGIYGAVNGLKLHTVKEILRYNILPDSVNLAVLTFYRKEGENNGVPVTFNYTFSAPANDVISVRVVHHSDVWEKHTYPISRENILLDVEDNEEELVIKNGHLKVVVRKTKPFGYDFCYDDKLLTSNNGDTALVTDINHEADLLQSTRHRKLKEGYCKETWLREMLTLDVGECIYGLGEHFTPFVKNGQVVEIWNRDSGTATNDAYKNIPFYLSSKGYGVFLNDKRYSEFDVGATDVEHIQFALSGESMEYMVIGGPKPLDVIANYTAITGRTPLPPAWTFGLWISSCWNVEMGDDVTKNIIMGMKEREIPFSVFHFDAGWMEPYTCSQFDWIPEYKNPEEMLNWIHNQGLKACVWLNPFVSQLSNLFEEGERNGYFLKTLDGKRVWQTDNWMPGMAIVDFTNPEASKWYTDHIAKIIRMGVDCVKTDFAEHIPVDVTYFDGSDPEDMHNYYPYLYYKAVYEMLQREKGENEACIFGRAATVGAQKFPVHWGGDCTAKYVSMAEEIRGGLSLCQSGYSFWAHDMAGFEQKATPDLYKRWAAFGLLSTHSRLHGTGSLRVPWVFDDEACDVLAFYSKLKCTLMPYLYSQAVHSSQSGHPMMRALMLDFDDKNCLYIDRQYMLGESLLVSPVLREDGTVEFYVPDGGVWINYIDNEKFDGGKWYTRKYDYFSLPLLVRPGSIIAVGAVDTTTEYDYMDGITYQLYGFENGMKKTVKVYDDKGNLTGEAFALMENDVLTFKTTNTEKPWSIKVYGMGSISQLEGGMVLDNNGDVRIYPNKSRLEVKIQFD